MELTGFLSSEIFGIGFSKIKNLAFKVNLHIIDEPSKPFKGLKQMNLFRGPKKNFLLLFVFLPLFLVLLGGNRGMGADKDMGNKNLITINKENNGKIIEINKGDIFRVELEELGSAGYQWHIDKFDKEYLKLVSKENRDQSGGRVGAPLVAIWFFKAKKHGQTEIAMDHFRNWEGKEKASAHFSIRLSIK